MIFSNVSLNGKEGFYEGFSVNRDTISGPDVPKSIDFTSLQRDPNQHSRKKENNKNLQILLIGSKG